MSQKLMVAALAVVGVLTFVFGLVQLFGGENRAVGIVLVSAGLIILVAAMPLLQRNRATRSEGDGRQSVSPTR